MNCLLCKSDGAKKIEKLTDFTIWRCETCGIEFSDPLKAGSAEYYSAFTEYGDKWEFLEVPRKLRERGVTGKLLDLGCGDGRFLQSVSDDFAVTGLDFNPRAIEVARQGRGIQQVHSLSLKDFSTFKPGLFFNVVSAFHILEHLEDPVNFLRDIKKVLAENGVLALSVPNPKRWALAFGRENWDWPPHHLTRWTEKSLRMALDQAGFRVDEICSEPVTTFAQVKSGVQDIVWAKVIKNFSFGIASKLTVSGSQSADAAKKGVRSLLVACKTTMIRIFVFVVAIIFAPFLILLNRKGKTLLVLAKK